MSRTLGACMQLEIRDRLVDRLSCTEVGHDQGVDAAQIGLLGRFYGAGQLAVGDQRIQGEIGLCAIGVAKLDGLAHRFGREIGRA